MGLYHVGIWEPDSALSQAVLNGLRAAGVALPALKTGNHPAAFAGEDAPLDLLVVAPGAVGWAGAAAIHAGVALICGAAGPLARTLQAGSAVSYGTSPRDTLTLSSLEGTQFCVAVQRELFTISGRVVERQELVLPFPAGDAPLPWLAAVGALLLLDVPPEELMAGFS